MKRFFWLSIINMIFVSYSFAQSGGQPGELMRFGVGAQSFSMGRAYTAASDGALSSFWNPANLSKNYWTGYNLDVMHMNLYGLSNLNYIGIAFPLNKIVRSNVGEESFWNPETFGMGVSFLNFRVGGIEERADLTHTNGEFSDEQGALYFSFSKSLKQYVNDWSVGFNLKYYYHNFYHQKSQTFLIDFGTYYKPSFLKWIQMGLLLRDLNQGDIGFAGMKEVVPLSVRSGILFEGDHFKSRYLKPLTVETDYGLIPSVNSSWKFYFGAKYDVAKINPSIPISVQMGFNKQNRFSFGLSFNFDRYYMPMRWQTRMDWAAIMHQNNALGNSADIVSFRANGPVMSACYYYEKGMEKFLKHKDDWGEEFFRKAVKSPELKKKGCINRSFCRLGDILVEKNDLLRNGKVSLIKQASTYYKSGTTEATGDSLFPISLIYYIQLSIIRKDYDKALQKADQLEKIGGKYQPYSGLLSAYVKLIEGDTTGCLKRLSEISTPLSEFYKAVVLFRAKKLNESESEIDSFVNKSQFRIPEFLYYPFQSNDNTLVDDVLYVRMEIQSARGHKPEYKRLKYQLLKFYPSNDKTKLIVK